MRRNTLFSKAVGLITLYAFSYAISPHPAHAARGLAPISFDEMYSLAENGEVEALRASNFRGLNIDSVNANGDTGLCIAARRHDVYTYNSFRAAGANPRHPCTQKISDYEDFLNKSKVVGLNGTSREALSAMGNKEDYKLGSSIWWWLGGAALVGGGLWLWLGHHHGGGDDDSGSSSGEDESYKSLGAHAYSKGKAVRSTTGTATNKKNLSYDNSSLANVGDINLQNNVLEYTDRVKSILYAGKGGSYTNNLDTLLNVGVGTIGMNAVKNSAIYNDGYIKIDSYSASVGMVASENSTAENHGVGVINSATDTNGINMNFSGYAENASVIGMYADTKSRIANYGDIYGKAIMSAKKESTDENSTTGTSSNSSQSSNNYILFSANSLSPTADEDSEQQPAKATSSSGTMVGMEAMILNVGNNLKNYTITVVNAENGKIYLSAGDSGTTSDTISIQLIGMGSYLDDAFLNGSNVLSRAERVNLVNDGIIYLNYSGNYSASSTTALRKGLGGIVGIRADANTEAVNGGVIDIILHDEFQNEGVDVAAGMQSVHGGNLTNNSQISIYTPSENKRINYGMMAVEGSGTNSSLYANIYPILLNSEDGYVSMQVSNSYGMASFVGGEVINKGHIVVGDKETRFNSNIAMYGYGSTKQSVLENTGTIDLHSYNSIAMQNDYAGGTDISNDGIINVYESATDSYAFGGAYSNLYNNNTINYFATSSKQERTAGAGVLYNPFQNYSISIGTSIMSSKSRSIKEDTVDFKSSTTEGVYNSVGAVINMEGSSYVSALSVETNDNATSTQAKAYNSGTINIFDRSYYNATNAIGMYIDSGSLNNAGIYNNGSINTESRFSAAMASNSLKNADVINNGEILTKKEYSLGIFISDVSNVINTNLIRITGSNSVGIQAGGTPSDSIEGTYEYPSIVNDKDGVIIIGNPATEEAQVENSFGIFADKYSAYNDGHESHHLAAQIRNDGLIEIYTQTAGAGIISLGDNSKIENNDEINIYGNDAYGIYSGANVTVINNPDAVINIGSESKLLKNSIAIYNIGDGSIANYGIINLYNDGKSYAIYSSGKADILNEGEINLMNENATAIYASHGTVTNRSSLKLNNDNNTGIELSGDAKATNESGISIDVGRPDNRISNSVGIKITEGEGAEATNKGTINLYNLSGSYAISAGGTATINNINTGKIYSYFDDSTAILVTGTVSVNNDGLINVDGYNAYAIRGSGEESVLSANNTGNITVGESTSVLENDSGAAIYASAIGSVYNSGSITVYNQNGYGIRAVSGNTIDNSGYIEVKRENSVGISAGAVSNVSNSGTIRTNLANSKGIAAGEGSTAINNDGMINIINGNDSYGIYTLSSSSVSNSSTISIGVGSGGTQENGNGIYAPNASGVNNSGRIEIDVARGGAITGNGTIINTGYIGAYQTNNFGIYSSAAASVQNLGTISIEDGYGISTLGAVTNGLSGIIRTDNGIAVKDAESLNNSGSITAYSTSSAVQGVGAIINNQDSSITNTYDNGYAIQNADSITNYGYISSKQMAIQTANSLNNSGTIENNSASATMANVKEIKNYTDGIIENKNTEEGNAIQNAENITNDGIIRSKKTVIQTADSLTNSGSVSNNSTTATLSNVKVITNNTNGTIENKNTSAGGAVQDAESVTNHGLIKSTDTAILNANSLTNTGTVTSASGLATLKNVTTVTNNSGGTIANTNSNDGYAVLNANTVINYGSISSKNHAIHFEVSGALKIENYSSVTTTGNIAIYADLSNAGSASIYNKGTIAAAGSNSYGIYVLVPNNTMSVSIVNDGNISAATGIYVYKNYHFEPVYDDQGKITGYNPDQDGTSVTAGNATYQLVCNGSICELPKTNNNNASPTSDDDPAVPVYADSLSTNSLIATNAPMSLGNIRLVNRGSITTGGNVDFGTQSADEAQISIGDGGSFAAQSFTGTVSAAADIVEDGFATTYVNEDSFIGENNGIEVVSQSYMFEASTQENADGNTDVVMTMKPFEEVVDDAGISEYLSRNYQQQNSETVFRTLKSAADKEKFTSYLGKELGLDFVPNLIKQSFDAERNAAVEIDEDLLNLPNQEARNTVSMTVYQNRAKDKGITTGYKDRIISAHGFNDRVVGDNLRAGLGLNFMRATGKYDNGSSRYNNTAALFVPVIFDEHDFAVLLKPKAGMSRGHYRRDGVNNIYKADTKEYFYGADVAAGKDIEFATLNLKPSVGMNLTELHTGSINESNGGLHIKKENTLSALSILGIDAAKKLAISDHTAAIFTLGAKYFHEFGDKYKNHAQLAETSGYFQIDGNRFERDFGLLKFKAEYDWENLGVDAAILVPIEPKQKPYYMLNAKYTF